MEKDINKDGNIDVDGFKSGVIGAIDISEFRLTTQDLNEIFDLISQNNQLFYADFMTEIDPQYRVLFAKIRITEDSSRLNDSSATFERSMEQSLLKPMKEEIV